MTDEIASPKIVITVTADQAKAALRDLKSVGSDAAKGLESALGTALDTTSKRLKRLSDDISGGKVTQGFKDLEKVLKDLGGVSNLSGSQIDRFREQIKKLEAQGGTAPASLGALAKSIAHIKDVTPGAASSMGSFSSQIGQLSPQLSGMASQAGPLGPALSAIGPAGMLAAAGIGAVVAAGGKIVSVLVESTQAAMSYADRFSDLSIATDMGTDALQTFAFSAKIGQGSVEQITAALFKMERALFKTPEVFRDLGLEISAFKALAPEDQLIALGDALEQIEDKIERDNAALEITGRKWGDLRVILQGVRDGASDTMDTIGAKMDSQMIAKMAALDTQVKTLDEAWQGLWRNIGASVGTAPGVSSGIDDITKALGRLSRVVKDEGLMAAAGDLFLGVLSHGGGRAFESGGMPANVQAVLDRNKLARLAEADIAKFEAGGIGALLKKDKPTPHFESPDEKKARTEAAAERKRERERERREELADAKQTLEDVRREERESRKDAADEAARQTREDAHDLRQTVDDVRRGEREAEKEAEREILAEVERNIHITEEAAGLTKVWAQELQNVVNVAQFMPKIFGDVLGSIAGIGTAMKGFDLKSQGGFSLTGEAGGLGGLLGNVMPAMQIAGIGLKLAKSIGDALTESGPEKAMKEVGRDWGVQISEGLSEKIAEDAKKRGPGGMQRGRGDAGLLNMGEILKEGGGVGAVGVDKTIGKLHDLFSAMERGTVSAKEAGAVFDDVFGQVLPLAIDKTTGRLQDNARELMRLAKERGVQSKEIDAFVQQQGSAALAGLDAFLKGAKVTSQASATAIGASIASIYDQLVDSGLSKADALKAITPDVQAFAEQLKTTGFEGGAAFAALNAQIALINDEKLGPAISAVSGLGQVMTALHNTNSLTQESFSGLSLQMTETFNAAVAEGADADTAMRALQPTLQTIFELQTDYGFAVDESTAKLLSQAQAAGLVGDAHRSAEDRMASSIERLAGVFELVAEKLGVTREQLDSLKDKSINVDVNVRTHGQFPTGAGFAENQGGEDFGGEAQFASGSGGLRNFGVGTRAMLHGEEAVVTRRQLNNIMRGAMIAGASVSGGRSGSGSTSGVGAGPDPVLLGILAELSAQTKLTSALPAQFARTTRDAVMAAKVNSR